MGVPTFKDLGKKVKDLFKKEYDYTSSVSIKNDADPLSVDLDLAPGSIKSSFTYKNATVGKVETSVESSGDFSCELTHADAFGLAAGCELKLNPVGQSLALKTACMGAMLTGSANANQVLEASAVYNGADLSLPNTNIGGSVKLDLTNEAPLVDYNAGVEYSNNNFILGVQSSNSMSKLTWSAYRKVNADTVFGVDMVTNTAFDQDKATRIGMQTNLDENTNIKSKIDVNSGILSTSVSHYLSAFNCKLVVASQVDILGDALTPKNIGIGLHF